jgi:hypothetical protein
MDELKEKLAIHGFRLEADDHIVTLMKDDQVIQRFSATGATADAILIGAQDYLQTGRNG